MIAFVKFSKLLASSSPTASGPGAVSPMKEANGLYDDQSVA